ncbi:MAG: M23 family metallopeptidase [Chloroflexi bacterium]|uniref:Peptidase M23 n=2 Tax=Candidatus Thermofonsia Clade 3 TaxID=2364209 RepID=A0A2M8QBH4_9CHLR|nr:MAG: peptidase M23 [Candidatus Thermofonsia Clade 3 bacterium]RMG65652.1 MAG: M23 family metallopeptidase [Chloroflexota bacterium]
MLCVRATQCRARVLACAAVTVVLMASPTMAQGEARAVFGLPFAEPPGPDTWLLGQVYGNTTGAFARRREWYRAGQGIHFGIDFSARCGTPIVAIGDGVVLKVDAPEHGSAPHNLLIAHPNGYVSLYGHLLERPPLRVGQRVRRGQVIGLTGDPDLTCNSRPHLHLEIRDRTLGRAFNAHRLIDADWDALMLVGAFGRGFQRDLDDPRKWQSVYDQPDIRFGRPLINEFRNTWPRDWN